MSTEEEDIRWPSGFGLDDLVGYGSTGLVVLDSRTHTVVKTPFSPEHRESLERERQIYERLGQHDSILAYHGEFEDGVRLDNAPNYDIQSYMRRQHVDSSLCLRWMTQLADALVHIHSHGVLHGDLTTTNIFLDKNLNVRLADFGASSIDLLPFLGAVTASHEYPGGVLSARGDIFALGSAMYEVNTGKRPFSELTEAEILSNFQAGIFPDVQALGDMGGIIQTCWQGGYDDSADLRRSILAIQHEPEYSYKVLPPRVLLCATAVVLLSLIYVKSARIIR
ncbi:spindle assembly checkpoint kinase [Cordyceps javanica]|uniref:EKC/KEOPS complex subunit BUD32 n=1 Tax=Cordyceps javanica TaxID=43265 RepID=A0A545W095_9HYPO|nr:spindle assembly checkpoint kinase [Cordyceps javanica]TQW07335.1 spindle assembly checkpoint kinase [Cordyceps javanica]